MTSLTAEPLSRADLRKYAQKLRSVLDITDTYFPVKELFEMFSTIIGDETFITEIISDNDLPDERHAYYDIENNQIAVKESVYDGACAGNGRDRMTLMHEMCHVLLIKVNGIKLYRTHRSSLAPPILAYKDPEWQAKCLAGEIMIPYNLVSDLSAAQIVKRCGVSLAAAKYQLNIRKKQ